MGVRWIRRRSHDRQLASGKTTRVRETWIPCALGTDKKRGSYKHECPRCQALIISVNMPNKGWAHFEGTKGLTRIKHRCFTMGEGLSRKRDEETPDLFYCFQEG